MAYKVLEDLRFQGIIYTAGSYLPSNAMYFGADNLVLLGKAEMITEQKVLDSIEEYVPKHEHITFMNTGLTVEEIIAADEVVNEVIATIEAKEIPVIIEAVPVSDPQPVILPAQATVLPKPEITSLDSEDKTKTEGPPSQGA